MTDSGNKNEINPFTGPHATPLSVLHNICHKRKINVEFTVLSVEDTAKPPEQIFSILLTLKGEDFEESAIGKGQNKKVAKQQAAVTLLELCGFDRKDLMADEKLNRSNPSSVTIIEKDLSNGGNEEGQDKEREYLGKKLREHMNNLEIVEAALKINPNHVDLKKIKPDLIELIRLVSQRILQRRNEKSTTDSKNPTQSSTEANKIQNNSSMFSTQQFQAPSKRKFPNDPLESSSSIKKPATSVPVVSNIRILRR